jgi:hypothetical protein
VDLTDYQLFDAKDGEILYSNTLVNFVDELATWRWAAYCSLCSPTFFVSRALEGGDVHLSIRARSTRKRQTTAH